MAQIMVIEPDELVTSALEKIFRGDEEVKITFADDFESAMEILNGNIASGTQLKVERPGTPTVIMPCDSIE